jgi:hypothetical protein
MPDGVYLSREQVKKRLGPLLLPFWSGQRKYAGFGDTYYYLPTPAEVAAFVADHPIAPAQVASQAFDCDDYAFVLKGSVCLYVRDTQAISASMCLGIAWGRFAWKPEFHACNWVLDAAGTFQWLEPQTKLFYDIGQCAGDLELVLV